MGDVFIIRMAPDNTVSDMAEAIKTANAPDLDHLNARRFILRKLATEIDVEDVVLRDPQGLRARSSVVMTHGQPMSHYFLARPTPFRAHILVVAPSIDAPGERP